MPKFEKSEIWSFDAMRHYTPSFLIFWKCWFNTPCHQWNNINSHRTDKVEILICCRCCCCCVIFACVLLIQQKVSQLWVCGYTILFILSTIVIWYVFVYLSQFGSNSNKTIHTLYRPHTSDILKKHFKFLTFHWSDNYNFKF